MINIKIREAVINDAAQIAKIHVDTWRCAYKNQIPDTYLASLSIKKRTVNWSKQLANLSKGVFAIVAEVDETVWGWCTFGLSRDKDVFKQTAELHGIYVHPSYIDKGLGTQLMQYVINKLKEKGYQTIILWVLTSNEKTRKWYESKGWKLEGKTKIEHRDNFDLHESRYMIKL